MAASIHDRLDLTIEVIDGVREEERSPERKVTLSREDIPELPDRVRWRDKHFAPDTVIIRDRPGREREDLGFDEVTLVGRTIRKDGKLGTGSAYCDYWARPEGKSPEQIDRIGEYLVPDYLLPYIDMFDPLHSDFVFTAE